MRRWACLIDQAAREAFHAFVVSPRPSWNQRCWSHYGQRGRQRRTDDKSLGTVRRDPMTGTDLVCHAMTERM